LDFDGHENGIPWNIRLGRFAGSKGREKIVILPDFFVNALLNIKIINKSRNPLPAYQTNHSAGMDLCADLDDSIAIEPLERKLIGTGLSVSLPVGFEAQIRPRSGLAFKHGLTVLNSPGTIDADYRGEIKVLLINLSSERFVINNGDRIAQMIVSTHETVDWKAVSELDETDRGAGGYGHTGI
jgi:dUTP pyrophosphatase